MSKPSRELELEHHIKTLRDALQDAPHSSTIGKDFYDSWYRQQRGPALDATAEPELMGVNHGNQPSEGQIPPVGAASQIVEGTEPRLTINGDKIYNEARALCYGIAGRAGGITTGFELTSREVRIIDAIAEWMGSRDCEIWQLKHGSHGTPPLSEASPSTQSAAPSIPSPPAPTVELKRYAVAWTYGANQQMLFLEALDGYWTPWHLAAERITALEQENQELKTLLSAWSRVETP